MNQSNLRRLIIAQLIPAMVSLFMSHAVTDVLNT